MGFKGHCDEKIATQTKILCISISIVFHDGAGGGLATVVSCEETHVNCPSSL